MAACCGSTLWEHIVKNHVDRIATKDVSTFNDTTQLKHEAEQSNCSLQTVWVYGKGVCPSPRRGKQNKSGHPKSSVGRSSHMVNLSHPSRSDVRLWKKVGKEVEENILGLKLLLACLLAYPLIENVKLSHL